MKIHRKIAKFLAAPVLALGLAAAAPAANAGVIQLGFILDSSGSIGASNWNTIKGGLANAINTLVPTDSSYEISVVNFSNTAVIAVEHVLIDSAATRTLVANTINNMTFLNSTTNMQAAFNQMSSILQGSSLEIDNSYVNFATDGQANWSCGGCDNDALSIAARNALIADAGVDNISVEAIGTGVDPAFLQNGICYPGPCTVAPTFSFPGNGFYIPVADANAYATAINQKVAIVTNQTVPEPGMVAIFALGLLGIAGVRSRMSA